MARRRGCRTSDSEDIVQRSERDRQGVLQELQGTQHATRPRESAATPGFSQGTGLRQFPLTESIQHLTPKTPTCLSIAKQAVSGTRGFIGVVCTVWGQERGFASSVASRKSAAWGWMPCGGPFAGRGASNWPATWHLAASKDTEIGDLTSKTGAAAREVSTVQVECQSRTTTRSRGRRRHPVTRALLISQTMPRCPKRRPQ